MCSSIVRLTLVALALVTAGCAAPAGSARSSTAPDAAQPDWAQPPVPMGLLGHRLGTYLTIEGVRAESGKVGARSMSVEAVNGRWLETPREIWIDNINSLPRGERITLRGYESGRYIGLPPEVENALNERRQAMWQFQRYFLAVPIDLPPSVKLVPERS